MRLTLCYCVSTAVLHDEIDETEKLDIISKSLEVWVELNVDHN